MLIIIGIFMLDIIKLNLPKINIGGESLKKKTKGEGSEKEPETVYVQAVGAQSNLCDCVPFV